VDFELTDEQEELRRSVHDVLVKECPPSLVREVVEKGTGADRLWARIASLGWPGLTVPEASGGIGMTFVELALLVEQLGAVVAPGPLTATATQFVPAVREAGTADQQARFLGPVAAGEATGTLAVAEAAGSWTAEAIGAEARADGDDFVLSGTKQWVADGATADELVVAARIGDDVGLFVVPHDAVDATPLPTTDASRGYATVVLDRARVGRDRLLGEPANGRDALRRAVEEATVATALETIGTCQALFDATMEYVKVREQFDVAIGSFQSVKHKLADAFIVIEKARATGYFAALTIAEDDPRRTLATSMAKAAAGECQLYVVAESFQLHGGIGYTWEHDLHLFLKRAMAGDALFGNAAEHRARVADLVGL